MYGSIPVSQFLSPKVFSSLVCLINFKTVFFNVIYHHFWNMLHTHVLLFTFVIQMHESVYVHVIYPCIVHIGTLCSLSLQSPLTVDGISLTRKQGSIVYASCLVPHAQSRTPCTQNTKAKKKRKPPSTIPMLPSSHRSRCTACMCR